MQLTINTTAAAYWTDLTGWLVGERTARRVQPQARTSDTVADLLRDLPHGATLAVQRPLGVEVVCLKGTLWITHDGDPADHVLESGCSYTAKREQKMLVYAMADARFIVEPRDD